MKITIDDYGCQIDHRLDVDEITVKSLQRMEQDINDRYREKKVELKTYISVSGQQVFRPIFIHKNPSDRHITATIEQVNLCLKCTEDGLEPSFIVTFDIDDDENADLYPVLVSDKEEREEREKQGKEAREYDLYLRLKKKYKTV